MGSLAHIGGKMQKLKYSLTEGPIFSRLFFFALPIMASGLLQVMYNMADNIVVGSFSGDNLALAAVGSTGTLTTLIVNFLMGFATGSSVIIARSYGAKDSVGLRASINTSAALAIIGGLLFALLSFVLSEPLLAIMGTKDELMSRAVLYFRIICVGIPASTVYNFGASILRSLGDSKKPLYILAVSGLANVILNFIFVIFCGMAVSGVALATIISQYLSAGAVVFLLLRQKDERTRLNLRTIGIDRRVIGKILRIAIPASLQSSLFSISNILIQSGVNQLSVPEVSGKTISGNIDGLVYTAMNSYCQTAMTFVSQNYGAKRPDRVKKIMLYTILQVSLVGIFLGQLILLFGNKIVGIYVDASDPNREAVIKYSLEVMKLILNIYFLCGIMETLTGILRGLGNSFLPMIISVAGVCGLRIVWILIFFPMETFHNLTGIYLSYPITWVFCITALSAALVFEYRKKKRKLMSEGAID